MKNTSGIKWRICSTFFIISNGIQKKTNIFGLPSVIVKREVEGFNTDWIDFIPMKTFLALIKFVM